MIGALEQNGVRSLLHYFVTSQMQHFVSYGDNKNFTRARKRAG